MSLPAILTASAALETTILVPAGIINHAYDTPPEVLTDLPVAIRFAERGTLHASRLMGRYNLYEFKIEVHFPRGVLQEAVALTLPVIEAYQDLYAANLSISGTCDVSGFREPAYEGPVVLQYKDATTIGVIFYMWAKEILDDITVNL